mgnify:CR=1 FL=1
MTRRAYLPAVASAISFRRTSTTRRSRSSGSGCSGVKRIVVGSLLAYPAAQIETALAATARQLVTVEGGEGVLTTIWHTYGIIERYTQGEIDAVYIVSNEFKSILAPRIMVHKILPIEPAAGMDMVALRKQYGRRLALLGGIDKHVLRRSKEGIRRELERDHPEGRVTPQMLELGQDPGELREMVAGLLKDVVGLAVAEVSPPLLTAMWRS